MAGIISFCNVVLGLSNFYFVLVNCLLSIRFEICLGDVITSMDLLISNRRPIIALAIFSFLTLGFK